MRLPIWSWVADRWRSLDEELAPVETVSIDKLKNGFG